MKYKDLYVSDQFFKDYSKAPHAVQKKVDKIIKMVSTAGVLPNGFCPHRAKAESGVHIGYASRDGQHYRILYFIVGEDVLEFDRLVDHDLADLVLKNY